MNKEVRENAVREAKQNLILDAARNMFGEKPFHDVRLEDIAEAAGFSKASLYNYYQSKEAIFLSLANREYTRLVEAVHGQVRPDAPLSDNLRAMTAAMFAKIGEHFSIILAFSQLRTNMLLHLEQLEQMHGELLKECGIQFSNLGGPFLQLLAQARAKGEFSCDLTDDELNDFLGGLFRSVMMRWKMAGRMGDTAKAVDDIVTFFLNGINYLGKE